MSSFGGSKYELVRSASGLVAVEVAVSFFAVIGFSATSSLATSPSGSVISVAADSALQFEVSVILLSAVFARLGVRLRGRLGWLDVVK